MSEAARTEMREEPGVREGILRRLSKVSEKCLLGIFSKFLKYSIYIYKAFFNVPGIILGPWIPMKILPLSLPARG